MAREHHNPKLNADEVLRNLLRRLKIDYEFFSRIIEFALFGLSGSAFSFTVFFN